MVRFGGSALVWLLVFCVMVPAAYAEEPRFLHEPDVSTESIVFVYGSDLWIVPLEGGRAKRLTSLAGRESHPRVAPDGATVAFSAEPEGQADLYLIGVTGGEPRRLTYHPSRDLVQGWSPDGRRVLFSSDRASDHFRPRLMTIDGSGGHPEAFPMHKAFRGAFSPDGRRLAFTPVRDAFRTWKRYRGGEAAKIWLVDLQDYSHLKIPRDDSNDTAPVWLGDSVYFLSDRSGVMSVLRYDVDTGAVEAVVDNDLTDIDSLAGSHGRLVYSSGGYVFLYDIAAKSARRVSISVDDDGGETTRGPKKVAELIEGAALSPDGSQVVFEARGELVAVWPSSERSANLTRASGSAERNPAWSPDGKSLAYVSDADGEYALYVKDATGEGTATPIGAGKPGYSQGLSWSPDGRKLAYLDKHQALWWVDLDSREHTRIGSRVRPADPYVWTPDSRGIVFADQRPTQFRTLTLHWLESSRSHRITDGMGDAHQPAFSRDGRQLFFLGSTNVGQVKTGLDLSVIPHRNEVTWSVFAVLLRAGEPSPYAPTSGSPASTGSEADPFRIDTEDLEARIVRVPLPAARYAELRAADGVLFLRELPSESRFAGEPRLTRFDLDDRESETLLPGVAAFELSRDGTTLLYRSEESWGVVATSGTHEAGAGKLDLSGLEIDVDPRLEWRQMFSEVWRNARDYFYDDTLHSVDWKGMRERYQPYLADVRYRVDLNYVLGQLVGELVNSHIRVGGPEPPKPEASPAGLLGADYEVVDGRYRVTRIVPAPYWEEQANPLTVPGVDVEEGAYLLEVDGEELRPPTNLHSLFLGKAGKEVTLRVGPAPDVEGSRVVTVVPLESEGQLRRRAWIERNLKRVDELSDGRIAYVYQPDTGSASVREFDRYFFPQSDRVAVVIDERFNDGGDDPDYQLDVLDRQQLHWYVVRNLPPFKSPFSMIAGPKAMLVNAEAGSGGDVYPYQYKLRRLGMTVGTRTWGGVHGGGGGPDLIDGGFARIANLGTWAPDGEYILENVGFIPDVEVEVYPRDDFTGRDPQLEKAVEILLDELRRNPPASVPEFERVDRSLERQPR